MKWPSWWDDLPFTRKVLDWPELVVRVKSESANGCDIAFANGVFDLLHPGHLLKIASMRRQPTDFVVLSIDTDAQVEQDKRHLPALSLAERLAMISAIRDVDAVTWHGAGKGSLIDLVENLAAALQRPVDPSTMALWSA